MSFLRICGEAFELLSAADKAIRMDEPSADRVTVRAGDRSTPLLEPCLPVVLFLERLRSAFNVGNIFRLAEATRVEAIVTCGYTASPPHPKLAKTARGSDQRVRSEHVDTATDAVRAYRGRGYRVYGVETVEGATPIWDVLFSFPAGFVLGNEALGIADDTLALCDEFVELPCLGAKNSINVGNCAAVVLYAALGQWLEARTSG